MCDSEKDLRAALEVIEDLAKVTAFHPVKRLDKYFKDVLSALSDLLQKYKSLKIAKIQKQHQLEILRDKLQEAADALYTYVEYVCDLYWYASDEEGIEKTKEAIQHDDLSPLTEFIKRLSELYLDTAKESCKPAEERLEEVRSSARDLVTDCETKAQEAKSNNHSCRRHTKTLPLIVVAFGVLSFVICGFNTGVCTGIVVTLLALIPCVQGREASKNYVECEREFRESSASRMLEYTRQIKGYLESLSRKVNIINQSKETHGARLLCRGLSSAFDRLCHKFRDFRTPTYRENLAAIDKDFRDRLEEIFSGVMKCSGDG